jgi:plasmid stability protein
MNELTYLQAIVIGLLQGVTELFPISSLGHSVLVPAWLGRSWTHLVTESATGSSEQSPYLAFIVALHVATACALLIFYRREWIRIICAPITTLRTRRVSVLFVRRQVSVSGHGLPLSRWRINGRTFTLLNRAADRPELALRGQTPETHEYPRVLVPPAPHSPPIPASAFNVAAQLLAVEARIDANPPRARVHLSDGLWLTVRAARIGAAQDAERRDIAVTIEQAPPAERLAVSAGCSRSVHGRPSFLGTSRPGLIPVRWHGGCSCRSSPSRTI